MKTTTCNCETTRRGVLIHDLNCPLVIREMSVASSAMAAETMLAGIRRREKIRRIIDTVTTTVVVVAVIVTGLCLWIWFRP